MIWNEMNCARQDGCVDTPRRLQAYLKAHGEGGEQPAEDAAGEMR